jgi:hypothetical protein
MAGRTLGVVDGPAREPVPSRRYALIVAPFLLERVKGMSLAEVAGTYSILLGITGIIGTLVAGRLVDRLGERDGMPGRRR